MYVELKDEAAQSSARRFEEEIVRLRGAAGVRAKRFRYHVPQRDLSGNNQTNSIIADYNVAYDMGAD